MGLGTFVGILGASKKSHPPRPGQGQEADEQQPDAGSDRYAYLAFAVMLGAGMKGVKEKYPLPDPVEEDIYVMGERERVKRGIEVLPGSLFASLQIAVERRKESLAFALDEVLDATEVERLRPRECPGGLGP